MTGVALVRYQADVHGPYVNRTWVAETHLPWHALKDLLRRPETTALVAVAADDADQFLGWAVRHQEDLVWWHVRYEELEAELRAALLQRLGLDPSETLTTKLPLTKEAA